jgi:hypothetical protein
MKYFESVLVALIVCAALCYLQRIFFPKKKAESDCGCGSVDCQVAKPKIVPQSDRSGQ